MASQQNPFDLLDFGGCNAAAAPASTTSTTTTTALTVPSSTVVDDDPFGVFSAPNKSVPPTVQQQHHQQLQQPNHHQQQHTTTMSSSAMVATSNNRQMNNATTGSHHSSTTAAMPAPAPASSGKWPSMLKDQWTSGCHSRQPSRQYMVICAKHCTVPGGIETLMRRGGNSASSAGSSSAATSSRNEQMILQIQNGEGGSRNAAYPDNMNLNNPVSGSLTNKARNLAGRFTKAAKGAVDMAERNISTMAIKAMQSNDPSKAPVDIVTAVVYVSQPILANYPGSAKFEEYAKTEPKRLSGASSEEQAFAEGGEEDEVVWALPVLLPPALSPQEQQQGKDRLVQVRIQMKSSAALTSKQYLVGSGTFSLRELLSGLTSTAAAGSQQQPPPKQPSPKVHFKSLLQSNVLSSAQSGAAIEVFVLGNRKYPPLGGMGWSATDPVGDYCGAMNAPYCPPLEQLYALKKITKPQQQQPSASSSPSSLSSSSPSSRFPHNVVLAIERTQESTVVLPLSTAMTRLLAEAAMHSAQHADSVARRLKSNALRFRDPIEALEENRHAECILDLCHLTRFSAGGSGDAAAAAGMCQVRIALQAPDCVFERPICASQVPVLLSNGGHSNVPGKGRIHTTFPFYPKRHQITVSDGTGGGPRMAITLGTLRFEVRMEGNAAGAGGGGVGLRRNSLTSSSSGGSGGGRMSPTSNGTSNGGATGMGMLWEGYATMDKLLDKPGGTFMEIPMFVTSGTAGAGAGAATAPVATLMIKLTARSPPPRGSTVSNGGLTSGQVLVPSQKGLMNLLNMKPLYGNGLLDNDDYQDYSSSSSSSSDIPLGDFFAMEWMDQYAKKRHLDAGTLVSRYESYKLALTRPEPQLSSTPVHQRKCPSWFRPSSAKTEFLLSGIPFNTHVQALVVQPLVGAPTTSGMAWHNITCGAAADHPRGFTNAAPPASNALSSSMTSSSSSGGMIAANEKPGGAGGVRRLEQKREELAKLFTDSEQKLRLAIVEYLQKHPRRQYVPVDEPYVAHHRASCFRLSQRLAELNWEIVKRRGNLLSQVLGQAVTAFLAAVSDSTRCNDVTTQRWLQHGFLLTYEGLLSAAGKETAMIEDAYSAIDMLQHVQMELVDAGPQPSAANTNNGTTTTSSTGPLGPKSINIVGSRVIRAIEIVRYEGGGDTEQQPDNSSTGSGAPLVDLLGDMSVTSTPPSNTSHSKNSNTTVQGQGGSLLVRVALDSSYYQNRVPSTLRGRRINFYAMLFQMGVDIMQWGANATSKMGGGGGGGGAQPPQQQGDGLRSSGMSNGSRHDSLTSSGSTNSLNEDDDDSGGGRGDEDNDLLVALNNEAFRKLNKYAFQVNPVNVDPNVATIIPSAPGSPGSVTVVHPMLQRLWQNICDSANKMEHGVLDAAGAAASELGGSGVIFCKSGKDRTAMQATLKQSQFLALRANVRSNDSSAILKDATLMRMYGTRLPICEKNVGQPKYAFNALQAKFMPEQLKPPLESVAGFLKGGSLFSRAGAIES